MIRPKTAVSTILFPLFAAAVLLCFAFPKGAGAFDLDVFHQLAGKNMEKTSLTRIPLATFRVPVDVTDMPPAFIGAKLIVDCAAYYENAGTFSGLVYGRAVKKGLINGPHYQGTVTVPAHDLLGMIAGQPRGVCLAMVEKGSACMAIGTACVQGPCEFPLFMGELSSILCEQNIFEGILEGRSRMPLQ